MTKPTPFKVGDRVIADRYPGEILSVAERDSDDDCPYEVRYDNGGTCWYPGSMLTHEAEAPKPAEPEPLTNDEAHEALTALRKRAADIFVRTDHSDLEALRRVVVAFMDLLLAPEKD